MLTPHAVRAQGDSVGVYCPMDFNATYTTRYLSSQLRSAIADGTTLHGVDMGEPVQRTLYGEGFYGDEIEAVEEVAKAQGYRQVLLLTFAGGQARFVCVDMDAPEQSQELIAELPEDITDAEFADLFQQVVAAFLPDYARSRKDSLPLGTFSL